MNAPHDVVANALSGDAVLFLGQNGLMGSADVDPVREAFSRRHGEDLYTFWLASTKPLVERANQVRDAGQAVIPPPPAQHVLDFPWRCVITTAIDSSPVSALGNRRLVTQITTAHFSDDTSDGSLRLLRLFGTVDRAEVPDLPPRDVRDLRSRREVAKSILGHLPHLVTPSGSFLVAGWSPIHDWLRPRDLAGCLSRFAAGQVLVFGLSSEEKTALGDDADFASLLDDRVVVLVEESLVEIHTELEAAGRLPQRSLRAQDPEHIIYRVIRGREPPSSVDARASEDLVDVPFGRLEWQNLTAHLMIPDDIDVTGPLPQELSGQYQAFRDFISKPASSSTLRVVRHLAMRRPVLGQIVARCRALCAASSPQETVLILRGQSGSGKSVLLCQLAVELRELGLPIVYAPSSPVRPDRNQIDLFCQHVEVRTDAPVFLLYDGLRDSGEYFDLAEYFASRGRKCVVVGTSYTFQATQRKRARPERSASASGAHGSRRPLIGLRAAYMDVPIELSDEETSGLFDHLSRFVEVSTVPLRSLARLGINHFFAAIYRALPDARGPLEEQFLRECLSGADYMERTIEVLQADRKQAEGHMGALQQALRAALGQRLDELMKRTIQQETSEASASRAEIEAMSATSRSLFDTVMFASWLGLQVPQSIALRLLCDDFRIYRGTFTAGLLAERESSPGVYSLSARNTVEAEIWVKKYLVTGDEKTRILRLIAGTLNSQEVVEDYAPELVFLIEMLRALGPEGPSDRRTPELYANLADVVSRLRQQHGEVSARLLLMESHAAREWVRARQAQLKREDDVSDALSQFMDRLKEAEIGLRKAYERVYSGAAPIPRGAARRLLATLETERACVIGTEMGSLNRCLPRERFVSRDVQGMADRWVEEAGQAWMQSLRWDESNRMAIDSACWIIEERFTTTFVDKMAELGWLATWSEMIDRYHSLDLSTEQADRRDEKEAKFAKRLGDQDRFEKALGRIEARGSSAAHALLARFIAEEKGPAPACAYLELHAGDTLLTDQRLLPRYARLWWWQETDEQRFFPRERMLLRFDRARWRRLLELVEAWLSFEPEHSSLLFLKACALVHLGQVETGVQVLRALDRLGQGGYRQSKSLVIRTDDEGQPVPYNAVFQGKTKGSTHLAWCDALRQNVEFFPVEHGKPDIRAGSSIGPFYLSLRYRGLFAEPTRRLKR